MSGAEEKILQYETFINETLKKDLHSVLEHRDRVYEDIAEFLALKNTAQTIEEAKLKSGQPLKTQVDLGCNFYAQARVPDPSRMLVEVGLGFYLELTLNETAKFVDMKVNLLEEKAKSLTEEACKIRATIKLILEGLRELQNLPDEDVNKKPGRTDLYV